MWNADVVDDDRWDVALLFCGCGVDVVVVGCGGCCCVGVCGGDICGGDICGGGVGVLWFTQC